ncbi:multicopper oxidase family protein [Agromyces sp. SYSU T00194]|uniref:multicopper oxidase family protein n=1 Tax=Agromyces chitinivorans TaxID=3158560 RepID=UPI003398DE7E
MDTRTSASRRDFLRIATVAGAGLVFVGTVGGTPFRVPLAAAEVPGGSLPPGDIPKYQAPVLVPPVMPRSGTITMPGGKPADTYEISMRQFTQQVLPTPLPATTLWGYGAVRAASKRGLLLHNAPSLTIEASYDRPVRVTWINALTDDAGRALPHLLPVDPTLHWANPPGGTGGRDSRPSFTSTPDAYEGPVPIVTHVHGAVGVGDYSDGYTEAWFLPDAIDIPASYATEGTWYAFFAAKAAAAYGQDPAYAWGPGTAVSQYPNLGRASTDWYHDHALGMTRLNVYAGPAGFYLIRGGPQGDDAVLDSRDGTRAVLPGPAPRENDKFPPNKSYREIALAVQDRSFNADGSLFYPDTRTFFDGIDGPFIPDSEFSPIWNPEFFGNTLIVNGTTWPFLDVEQRRYRLRFLNGCQSRFLILDFAGVPGVRTWAIGNEGGFLDAPVDLTSSTGDRLLLGPAERADLIVDFTDVPVGQYVLQNVGPDEPFGGGVPGVDFDPADPLTTGQVMQFRVAPAVGQDATTPPAFLQLPLRTPLPPETATRRLALIEESAVAGNGTEGPVEAQLGVVADDGTWSERTWDEALTENPTVGGTEVWELYNTTGDAHPIHIHEVAFEVVDRQPILVDEGTSHVEPVGSAVPPELWETGVKDTVIAYPGEVTRVRAQFNTPGQYVWHCHIVEHEDNEMMRPFRVGPPQTGQPT